MPELKPKDIKKQVLRVLRSAAEAPDGQRVFLTAYQILDRLGEKVRARLIKERTIGGRGTGRTWSAARVVSKTAEHLPGIEISHLDTENLVIHGSQDIIPTRGHCAIYRLKK